MSNEKLHLEFSYNKNEIEIILPKNELESLEVVKIELQNINIKNSTELKINNKK